MEKQQTKNNNIRPSIDAGPLGEILPTEMGKKLNIDDNSSVESSNKNSRGGSRSKVKKSQVTPNTNDSSSQNHEYGIEMKKFTLRFQDDRLEQVFRRHYNQYVVGKVRLACYVSIILHFIMAVLEVICDYSKGATAYLLLIRFIIILVTLGFLYLSYFQKLFCKHHESLMMTFYFIRGTLLIILYTVGFTYGVNVDENTLGRNKLYFFYSGRWSLPCTLFFISICFNISGMRFFKSTIIAWYHLILMTFIAQFFYRHEHGVNDPQIFFAPFLVMFCMASAYNNERQVRLEFVLRCNVTEDRRRRDILLESMLPAHISKILKEDRKETLAEYFDEVTILFCYISGFNTICRKASPVDLVRFINRIVSSFDKATDAREVYKVEAIAETYMCAAGVPTKDPLHCEKIANMALTMMHIVQKEQWTFNNEPIQLQIGIHSGPVAAGVIGVKAYSYHLFGDAVNTTSRMCSTALPGHIQLSERSYDLLKDCKLYELSERGLVQVKGKGQMRTYWLHKKYKGATNQLELLKNKIQWDPNFRQQKVSNVQLESDRITMKKWTLNFTTSSLNILSTNKKASQLKEENQKLITLAQEIERDFIDDYNKRNLTQFQGVFSGGIIVLFLALINELNFFLKEPYLVYRVALKGCGVVLLLFVVITSKIYRQFPSHMQEIASIVASIIMVIINLNLFLISSWHLLDVNMICITIVTLFLRLRFVSTIYVNIFIVLIYGIFLIAAGFQQPDNIVGYLCNSITTVFICEFSCYKREFGLRLDFLLKRTLKLEKQKCEELLANMLPSPRHAEALMIGATIVDELQDVTLLYSDMVGFTALSAKTAPNVLSKLLNKVYSAFDSHIDCVGVYKMDTIGDAFIAIGGLPNFKSEQNHPYAVLLFAIYILEELEKVRVSEGVDINIRIGIHTGKVVGGVVGIKKPRYLIWGHDAIVANTMESKGIPGRIHLSQSTYERLKDLPNLSIDYHEEINIGCDKPMPTYLVNSMETCKEQLSAYLNKSLETLPGSNTPNSIKRQGLVGKLKLPALPGRSGRSIIDNKG